MENVWPQLGFGFLAGYSTGLALRFIGRTLAFFVGTAFMLVQLLAYLGYVQVDWYRIQQDLEPALSSSALQAAWQKLLAVLTYNAPFGGGFIVGLGLGLRGR